MNLKLFNRKQESHNFISLIITDNHVAGALWNIEKERIQIVQRSEVLEWQPDVESSLTDAGDVALEQLGSVSNVVGEVLLGLPENWAHEQSIAVAKKPILKELTMQLNLKSVGFVVTDEAIIARLREKQIGPLHAVVCLVGLKNSSIHIVRSGISEKLLKVTTSTNLAADLIDAFTRAHVKDLPTKVYLASLDQNEEAIALYRSQLIAHEWDKEVFPKTPEVELLSIDQVIDSVCLSGGYEVAKSLGLIVHDKKEKVLDESPVEDEKDTVVSDNISKDLGFSPVLAIPATEEIEDVTQEGEDDQINLTPDEPQQDFSLQRVQKALPKKIIIALITIALVLILICLGVFVVSQKASVVLTVGIRSQPISIDTPLLIDPTAATSQVDQGIVKATTRPKEVSGSLDAQTTGSAVIGDKATGSVTIANHTIQSKLLKAGTVLTTGSLHFTLNADITIASASSSFATVSAGQATATITASAIGADSNIPKDTLLSVGGFDKTAFEAKANDVFSGGTSRSTQVVSASDQKQLADTLYAQLKTQAQDALTQEAATGEHIIVADTAQISKKEFSNDVGTEAKTLTLNMTIQAQGIVFTSDDLKDIASQKLASQIVAGASLIPNTINVSIHSQQATSSGQILIQSTISSRLMPAFNPTSLKSLLAGKTIEQGKTLLNGQQAISTYTLSYTPSFASFILLNFPKDESKIVVVSHQLQ